MAFNGWFGPFGLSAFCFLFSAALRSNWLGLNHEAETAKPKRRSRNFNVLQLRDGVQRVVWTLWALCVLLPVLCGFAFQLVGSEPRGRNSEAETTKPKFQRAAASRWRSTGGLDPLGSLRSASCSLRLCVPTGWV